MMDDNDTCPDGSWAGPIGPDLAAQLAEKEREIARLQAWKEPQLKVTPDWQKIGELLNIGWGQSVTENIIPAIMALRERLRQREAELEQRWIAVGDRLPDEPQHDVLLWTADDWEGGKNFQQVGVIGEFNQDEWDGKVTHWQPLPSPPKEANDGH